MARRLFGTDGIRGTANQPPMTAEMALRLGWLPGGTSPAATIAIVSSSARTRGCPATCSSRR